MSKYYVAKPVDAYPEAERQSLWWQRTLFELTDARSGWLIEALITPTLALFRRAAYCFPPLFELRGTSYSCETRPILSEPLSSGAPNPALPPRRILWSYSNSAQSVLGVETALCAGDHLLAARISSLATDQPEDNRFPPNPKAKRPNEFFLAFALQSLFAGRDDEALRYLGKLKFTPRQFTEFGHQKRMLQAILMCNADEFVRGLVDLLEWFEPWAKHPSRRLKDESYGCWAAAAWSVLACRRGVLSVDDLPDCSSYYPLDLVRAAVAFDPAANPFRFREFTVEEFGFNLSDMTDEWKAAAGMTANDGKPPPNS